MTNVLSDLRREKESLEAQREELCQQVDTQPTKCACLAHLGKGDHTQAPQDPPRAQSARDDETREKETVKQALSKADTEVAKLRDRCRDGDADIRGELAVNQVALVAEQTTTSMLRSEMTAARGEFSMPKTELETARKNLIDARVEEEQDL